MSAILPASVDASSTGSICEVGFAVEAVRLDDVELPGQRPGPLHRQANAVGGAGPGGGERHHGGDDSEAQAGKHLCYPDTKAWAEGRRGHA